MAITSKHKRMLLNVLNQWDYYVCNSEKYYGYDDVAELRKVLEEP